MMIDFVEWNSWNYCSFITHEGCCGIKATDFSMRTRIKNVDTSFGGTWYKLKITYT
jgi:hypothetical protein